MDFDPNYKLDRVSGERKNKLMIHHNEHPHKEQVELVGTLCFPNLAWESMNVNFGAILIETQKKIGVSMKNSSMMPLVYEWSFMNDEIMSKDTLVPINQVFDILPLSGLLAPGETEDLYFMFQAINGQKYKTTAICHVEGGPNYEIVLTGDSSA